MIWVYIVIGLVAAVGLAYWLKSKKKEEVPETPQLTETEETPSDEEKPM